MTTSPADGPAPHGAGPRPLFSGPPYLVPPALQAELTAMGITPWQREVLRRFGIESAPLPRRTRLKLAVHRHLTTVGIWLGDHVSWTLTDRLWRATGLLGRKR